jgi:hypothetical protein
VVIVTGDFSDIMSVESFSVLAVGLNSVVWSASFDRRGWTGDDGDGGRTSVADPEGEFGGESLSKGVAAASPAAIPPAAESPARSRCARHALYVIVGNRSLTSSIFRSFFSRLRRWTGWWRPTKGWRVARSTSSSNWAPRRLRWEYRKQYFTPTMILKHVSIRVEGCREIGGEGAGGWEP